MVLDVYNIKLGTETMPSLDPETTGFVAVKLLDAVQTVVDVLTDNDGHGGWTVTFDPTANAYTDRSAKRKIVVSVKPLYDARPGDSLAGVASIMTGLAVHEIGHTKLNFYDAIQKRWPGKKLPLVLGNIIEDVVLEARTVDRYAGFADNGNGTVFHPALDWMAGQFPAPEALRWSGTVGHKVNVVGQIVRYRDYVTFSADETTQTQLRWVEEWAEGITARTEAADAVVLIETLLDHIKATLADDEDVEPPVQKPPVNDGGDDGGQQTIPDDEDGDDDTEGGDQPGGDDDGGNDTEGGDDDGGEGEGNPTTKPGTTEGDDDADGDDEGGTTDGGDEDGTDTTDGGEDGEGRDGDGNDADTMNRGEAKQGTNDQHGGGGSGQSVSEASEPDVDDGFDPADLDPTFDDMAKPENTGQQDFVNRQEQEERRTTRLDAGEHGKMRVIFR